MNTLSHLLLAVGVVLCVSWHDLRFVVMGGALIICAGLVRIAAALEGVGLELLRELRSKTVSRE